ncbi:restriction endonuclease subunit S [Salinicoccus sp. ID82-1]|uniref:restriction endonuclease subunit S n=1 Tax=Salinicoccus sp. ID82-1 TaxID=2820269 RepID=UPI001F27BC77|nr:restriction endonuclease subunit S [Salinicoccus sp. ID82-1]MCG1010377.1 restriction endonuclease subunit S [Salinicoccus sp. ID82-1]
MTDKLTLANVKWKKFKFDSLFEIEKCKCNNASLLNKNIPEIPYVGATNARNGTMYFVKKEKKLITKGKCIVFVMDGEGSMGTSFYKEEDFIGSTTLSAGYNKELNKYNAMFLTTIMDQNKDKYNFGYKRNLTRLKKETILLPIDEVGEPYWALMEKIMRDIEEEVTPKESFIPHEITDKRELADIKWKSFRLGDIFKELIPGKSKGLVHLKEDGTIPYVGATNKNNGVLTFVEKVPKLTSRGNTIIFIRNGEGSMGYSVYKFEEFIATSDVTMGYNSHINKYTGTFITTVADKVRGKYNFGYKRNNNRLRNERLLLPEKGDGNPDWEFMEQYMKRIENELFETVENSKRYFQ